jgi:hypothetical protein
MAAAAVAVAGGGGRCCALLWWSCACCSLLWHLAGGRQADRRVADQAACTFLAAPTQQVIWAGVATCVAVVVEAVAALHHQRHATKHGLRTRAAEEGERPLKTCC